MRVIFIVAGAAVVVFLLVLWLSGGFGGSYADLSIQITGYADESRTERLTDYEVLIGDLPYPSTLDPVSGKRVLNPLTFKEGETIDVSIRSTMDPTRASTPRRFTVSAEQLRESPEGFLLLDETFVLGAGGDVAGTPVSTPRTDPPPRETPRSDPPPRRDPPPRNDPPPPTDRDLSDDDVAVSDPIRLDTPDERPSTGTPVSPPDDPGSEVGFLEVAFSSTMPGSLYVNGQLRPRAGADRWTVRLQAGSTVTARVVPVSQTCFPEERRVDVASGMPAVHFAGFECQDVEGQDFGHDYRKAWTAMQEDPHSAWRVSVAEPRNEGEHEAYGRLLALHARSHEQRGDYAAAVASYEKSFRYRRKAETLVDWAACEYNLAEPGRCQGVGRRLEEARELAVRQGPGRDTWEKLLAYVVFVTNCQLQGAEDVEATEFYRGNLCDAVREYEDNTSGGKFVGDVAQVASAGGCR